ncbi:MAG: hypothetical protein JW727_01455 [Candidatus Aenigmarchaeota archaeon]|nr:hypothetical protein [Candidatus Aenigmarchaeota archaeon]
MRFDVKGTLLLGDAGNGVEASVLGRKISKDEVFILKELFEEACRKGCSNYGKNHSCPPHGTSFNKYTRKFSHILAISFCVKPAEGLKTAEIPAYRELESVSEARIDKLMRSLEEFSGSKYISARSCRICSPCRRAQGKPCKNPDLLRHCTCALGIDCGYLSEKFFQRPIVWQKGAFEGYLTFICLLPFNEKDEKKIFAELRKKLKKH